MPQVALQCAQPFADTGFAAIDFLALADQADDDAPIGSAVHDRQQERRLGLVEIEMAALAHEVNGRLAVPSALRFIEHHDMFGRDMVGRDILVAEMMDVLDELVG